MGFARILKLYYVVSFVIGVLLTLFIAHEVASKEIGMRGALIITVSLNVLLIMLLPLVLDWAERHYFKARFLAIEEIEKTNPELASALAKQCQHFAIPNLRLAIVESSSNELFSYGLWRINPRLILSKSLLTKEQRLAIIPSIEAELAQFASQDCTLTFLLFIVMEEILQIVLLAYHLVR